MSNELLSGIAVGGPRDGVKIDAPVGWNGKIKKPNHSGVRTEDLYKGYYNWEFVEYYKTYSWVWHTDQPKKTGKQSKTKM